MDSPAALPSGHFLFLVLPPLLNAGATALNQDDQHKNKKDAGGNPDDIRCVHCDTPFRVFGSILLTWCEMLQAPPGSSMNSELLNPGAAALNQDDQHKNKEHAGSNTDNCRGVHCDTPFPCLDPDSARCFRLRRIPDEISTT